MLGLRYPIFQAPMAGVSTVELAAAITKLGGLGALPLAAVDLRHGCAEVQQQIDVFRQLVPSQLEHNVNLNFFCHDRHIQLRPPTTQQEANWRRLFGRAFGRDVSGIKLPISNVSFQEVERNSAYALQFNELMQVLRHHRPKVVSFHFGSPLASTVAKLQQSGISVYVCVTSLAEADLAVGRGVGGVVCQGYEAGGHRGNFLEDINDERLSTEALTKQVVAKHGGSVVVVAAGGIGNANDVQYYLDIGADAVQVGTAFLDTAEVSSAGYILRYKNAPVPTVMTPLVSGKGARCLKTPFIENLLHERSLLSSDDLPPYGYAYAGYKAALKEAADPEKGFFLAGEKYPAILGEGAPAEQVWATLIPTATP